MSPRSSARRWAARRDVPGIDEVFHARFVDHAYPRHTHSTWTLLVVDDGAVRYALDRAEHGAAGAAVTLLPPGVAHDGRSVTAGGFRRRVLYLDDAAFPAALVGRAVDRPAITDDVLRGAVDRLHHVLDRPGDELSARSGLALVTDRLRAHLGGEGPDGGPVRDPRTAGALRDLLDAHVVDGLGLDEAAATLHVTPTHLVKAFSAEFGLPPHRYLVGRRVETARRLLLAGLPPARVAVEAGFHDQAHLTRHFRRLLGVTPGVMRRHPTRSSHSAGRPRSAAMRLGLFTTGRRGDFAPADPTLGSSSAGRRARSARCSPRRSPRPAEPAARGARTAGRWPPKGRGPAARAFRPTAASRPRPRAGRGLRR